MPKDEVNGFKRIAASKLPQQKQQELHLLLQHDLTEALIKAIKSNPPEVDLAQIELVLRPGQALADFNVAASCGTCGTCSTCGTCGTCGTASLPSDIPAAVIKELGIRTKAVVDKKVIKAGIPDVVVHR